MRIARLFLIFCVTLFPAVDVGAASPEEEARLDKMRVAMAGRQRMLTQRIAKAACLTRLTPTHAHFTTEANTALDQFANAVIALRDGDSTTGLQPERAPIVVASLGAMEEQFVIYETEVRRFLMAEDSSVDRLATLSEDTLDAAKHAVTKVVDYHSNRSVHAAKVQLLDIAGRQRMLTQRMAKYLCFLATRYEVDATVASLEQARALFTSSLQTLRYGSYGLRIPGPAPERVRQKLDELIEAWEVTDRALSQAVSRRSVTPARALAIIPALDATLAASHEIVQLY